METQETPEIPQKEGRERQAKLIPITAYLSVSEHSVLMSLKLKMMKRSGQDIPREKVIAEALQSLQKHGVGND